jgi:hypothetical protein
MAHPRIVTALAEVDPNEIMQASHEPLLLGPFKSTEVEGLLSLPRIPPNNSCTVIEPRLCDQDSSGRSSNQVKQVSKIKQPQGRLLVGVGRHVTVRSQGLHGGVDGIIAPLVALGGNHPGSAACPMAESKASIPNPLTAACGYLPTINSP